MLVNAYIRHFASLVLELWSQHVHSLLSPAFTSITIIPVPDKDSNNMGSDVEQNGEAQPISNKESTYGLSTVPTSITLSPEQFERMYLSPMMHRQGSLAKQVGNPTPL